MYDYNQFHIGCLSYASDSYTSGVIGSAVSIAGLLLFALIAFIIAFVGFRWHRMRHDPSLMSNASSSGGSSAVRHRMFNSNPRPHSMTRGPRCYYEHDIDAANNKGSPSSTLPSLGHTRDIETLRSVERRMPADEGYTYTLSHFAGGDDGTDTQNLVSDAASERFDAAPPEQMRQHVDEAPEQERFHNVEPEQIHQRFDDEPEQMRRQPDYATAPIREESDNASEQMQHDVDDAPEQVEQLLSHDWQVGGVAELLYVLLGQDARQVC